MDNVSYHYNRKNAVLDAISLQIRSGRITGLFGLNGIGKTTLIKLLAGLLTPSTGHIRVLEHSPRDRSVDFLQRIFITPDEFSLPQRMTGNAFAKHFGVFYPTFDDALFRRMADAFAINLNTPIGNGSFGERKKLYLAFGFATRAQLMLFDEPTSGLDIPSKSVFRDILIDLVGDDISMFISTHEPRELPTLLDTVCFLNESLAVCADLADIRSKVTQIVTTDSTADAIYSEKHPLGHVALAPSARIVVAPIE